MTAEVRATRMKVTTVITTKIPPATSRNRTSRTP
jgi:hypothetical protein